MVTQSVVIMIVAVVVSTLMVCANLPTVRKCSVLQPTGELNVECAFANFTDVHEDLNEVTGGAGFVGSHLVDALMFAGHEVIVLDNFYTGRKRNVEHWVGHPSFELVHHDVVHRIEIQVDQIYQLASQASSPHYMHNPITTMKRAKQDKRPVLTEMDYWTLLQNCTNIYQKFYWPSIPLSLEEANFPLAFSIMMNEDMDHVIRMINAVYAPQNLYCIHIDWKAPAIIHDVMRLFAGCMANVIISSKSESVVREGYTSLQASLNCLSDLRIYHSRYRWKYALMLQGKDFPLRTNRELVDILTLYDGANDVELLPPMPERFNWSHSYIKNQEGLPIDIEDKDGPVLKSPPPASLTIYKGSTGAALSAKFVDFMMDDPRSRELQQWLQDTALPDECLWSTINHDERLKAPGGYPGSCLWKSDKKKDWISRFAIWGGTPDDSLCKEWRHGVCLIGVDELPHIVRREELFMNKFWIRDDPIALDCLHEHLFNRTYKLSPIMNSFSLSSYKNLSPVRFQQLVRRLGYVIATKLFKC